MLPREVKVMENISFLLRKRIKIQKNVEYICVRLELDTSILIAWTQN